MKTNSKITVVAVVAVLVGYVLGAFIGLPGTSGNLGSGDISKASKFHKASMGSQTSALEQKLKSDTLAFNEESATVALINSRMTDFADLVDYTIMVASDKAELSDEVNSLAKVKDLSMNAVQTGKIASASLEYLETGKKNDLVTDYEQASQNLVVAFMMVDRQVQLGKQFVAAADFYLNGKSLEDVPEIALVRDLWAEYCAESAWLNGDKQEMKYWGEQTTIASADIVAKGAQKLGSIQEGSWATLNNRDKNLNTLNSNNQDRNTMGNRDKNLNTLNSHDKNLNTLNSYGNGMVMMGSQDQLQKFLNSRGGGQIAPTMGSRGKEENDKIGSKDFKTA